MKATVLVVVVLTVIIFGGTTSRMLEILHIRTGVVEEIDSDDEFDTEPVPHNPGLFARRTSGRFGSGPNGNLSNGGIGLNHVSQRGSSYTTAHPNGHSPVDFGRRNSSRQREVDAAEQGLLDPDEFENDENGDDEGQDLDLPPAAARRSPQRPLSANPEVDTNNPVPLSGSRANEGSSSHMTARGAISQILNATSEDAGTLFSKLDENFLKPHLLLDPGGRSGGSRDRSGSRDRGAGA